MDKNMRAYLAELIGTFALVLISAGTVCAYHNAILTAQVEQNPEWHVVFPAPPSPGLLGIALAYGLTLAVVLAITVPYADGYLNPAVALVLWVNNRISVGRASALI